MLENIVLIMRKLYHFTRGDQKYKFSRIVSNSSYNAKYIAQL